MPILRTFGAVHLAADDGTPLGGAAGQRRLLALLALVAAAGPAGISRDRLLLLLWPETEEEKARRALAQALYHARRTLGHDDLFIGGTDVRLNRERLDADILAFDDALAANDLERAAELHRGPFLDGFHIPGSAELEQWASTERARYARRVADALEALARRAGERGDHGRAVEWRRRAVALDPLDGGATARLIEALAASGDRAGALRQARLYESLVREELGVAPEGAVSALVERLRAEPKAADRPAAPGVAIVEEQLSAEVAAPEPAFAAVRERVPTRRARGRIVALLGGSALVVALVALAVVRVYHTATGAAAVPPAQPLVVAPFRVAAADPSLAYLREGMVELLSARLAGDSALHSVDPGVVIGAWRRAPGGAGESREDVVRRAAALGARQVVIGSVVGAPSRLVVSASLLDVPGSENRASVSVEGSADSLTSLVDRVAVQLLAAEAGESERLGHLTTLSLPALRAYLDGQAAYRRGDYSSAAMRYERALASDSGFALAALQLAIAADRLNDAQQHARALALAWGARDELADRDRAYLLAFAGPRYPAPSPEAEQLAAWERAVALSPDRPDAWYELGERYFHDGAVVAVPNAPTRATAALRRALALDPGHLQSRRLLLLAAARQGDTATLTRLGGARALADSIGELGPFLRWRVALARGDQGALRAARSGMPRMSSANLRAVAMSAQFDGIASDDAERALRILRHGRPLRSAELLDVLLAEHSLALNEGQPVRALDVTEQIEELQPGTRAHLRLRVLDALYGDGDAAAAREAAEELAARLGERPSSPTESAVHLADACVVGQWKLASGSTRGVDRIVRELRAATVPRVQIPVSASPLTCAELLDATAAVVGRRADAIARLAALDALMLSGPAVGDAGNYAHLAVARLYERSGDRARALAAIRRRPYMTGWPRYLTTTRREETRLAAAR